MQAGEVRLRVAAAALNFRDVLLALGVYPGTGIPLGAECAGTVIECGAGVDGLRVGDAVFGFAHGSMASEAVVPAASCRACPPRCRSSRRPPCRWPSSPPCSACSASPACGAASAC
ncbi:alcohol dehydrogenase catalytic domain-containing protein [Hydrogenophaga sp. SNF1]|uniref:alcohol dehydrogenase catalytic domain-containing protein n=1 Tax=Hydrogenophaga sp. SNF1 TaxID=3098762 RepID=UPI002ACBE772|nr:alcohol dehydrogenase catalytic domain-containing protein [Hydrogenophaga sp. SNF1]WQB85546.1 alcohol dehydrogenase catalytic domain-containing protein [Hydrogenophaga sp. SNF1]